MIPHELTVAQLRDILSRLEPDDLLVMNRVRNLAVVRQEVQIGYIDCLVNHAHLELYSEQAIT